MQILRNKTTNEEYPITGSLGVPREVSENVFEVWTHFSVDLGEGRVDTIEVHPESTEYEVIDVPDPEPVVEEVVPEPTPEPEPVIAEPTPEEIERNTWLEQFRLLERSLRAKEKLEAVGLTFSLEEQTRFDALVQWVAANRKIEYVEYM